MVCKNKGLFIDEIIGGIVSAGVSDYAKASFVSIGQYTMYKKYGLE